MKKKMFILMISVLALVGIFGTSYAFLRAEFESDKNQKLGVANFGVELIADTPSVNLSNSLKTYPMEDTEGLNNPKMDFSIKNSVNQTANYRISLVDTENMKSTMSNEDVRYQLTKTRSSNNQTEILEIQNLNLNGILDEGTIEPGEVITFSLVMWIDIDANPNGQTFSKVVLLEGMQAPTLDKSGANYPELLENMIPVYYDALSDTAGSWKVADVKNLNATYEWYDYDNFIWANAVTVKENGTKTRDYYLNAPMGTEVLMEDITSMWVWVPRYKYTIFDEVEDTSKQVIDVTFEHGLDTTGTVTCTDKILTSPNSASSEICKDNKNGSITPGVSTYTHPAFTFGDEELTGIWVSKFEMSTDDNSCTTNPTSANCNKNNLNIIVKPNTISLTNVNVSNMFSNIRSMEVYGNIHGFEQSNEATVALDKNNNLTGEIANDNNNFDTHMIKNMEWGAISYLSSSKYGKQGNDLYKNEYKDVYTNNYLNKSTYKSGYSATNRIAINSSPVLYNNLTINNAEQGYLGAGASTTGTIYGVYDMSGGASEYVMANQVNTSGGFYASEAGTWSGTVAPLSKYYEKYSYSNSNADLDKAKLGDSIKETPTSEVMSENDSWGSYGIMTTSGTTSSLFKTEAVTGAALGTNTSRAILTVTRELPWK